MLIAGVQILHLDICLSPCIFVSVIKNECAVTLYVLRNESQFLIDTNSAVSEATRHDEISWVEIYLDFNLDKESIIKPNARNQHRKLDHMQSVSLSQP